MKTRSRYLILGVILGLFWYVNGAQPLWQHALRMLLIMAGVLIVLELLARRRHRGGGDRPHIAHGRIIAAKLVLLAVAVGAEWLLDLYTSRADLIVAIGLAVVVAVAGPPLEHHLVRMPSQR